MTMPPLEKMPKMNLMQSKGAYITYIKRYLLTAGDHRRGRRGRGPGHPRGQPHPRHLQVRGRQGPRLRRPPQGDAPGHGHPHRRHRDLRDCRPQAGERHHRGPGAGPQGGRHLYIDEEIIKVKNSKK